MSVADELEKSISYLEDAYAAIEAKGGVMPQKKNMAYLAGAIRTIPINDGGNGGAGNGEVVGKG